MAETNDLDRTVSSKFTISGLNTFQMKAISEFVKGKSDIFVWTRVDVESGASEYCGNVHAKGFPKNTAGRL